MTERIVEYLSALVATIGGVESSCGLAERMESSDGSAMPYIHVGGGEYTPVEVDSGSVSYWRLRSSVSSEVISGGYKVEKQRQVVLPLRFVAMVRRDTTNPLTFADDVENILTGNSSDLRYQLNANRVVIRVSSRDTDTTRIWREEFTVPVTDPNYTRSMVMVDLSVEIQADRSCWENCDNYPDILRGFDWCNEATYQRLSAEQIACLTDFLCGTPPTLCEQLAEILPENVVAAVFDCLTDAAQTELLDSECPVPVCPDGTVNITNTDSDPIATVTVASGGTEQYVIPNVAWTQSDGTPQSIPYGDAIVCTPPPPMPTVALALSDPTPTFGDAINVTATPSGFTPTSYRFEVPTDFDNFDYVVQGGNVLSWTVNRLGAFTIRVEATDGSGNTAVGSVTGTAPSTLPDTFTIINDESLFNGAASLPNGTAITSVTNQLGADDYEQSVVARQPLYLTAGINGLPAMRFAAVAKHLYKTDAITLPEQVCITSVGKGITTGIGGIFSVGAAYNDGATPYLMMWREAGVQFRPYQIATGFTYVGRLIPITATVVCTMNVVISSGAKYYQLWVNGIMLFESRQIASSAGSRVGEFIGHAFTQPFNGDVGHYERINRACSAQEIKERHRLLMDKWL